MTHKSTQVHTEGETKVQQQFKSETNVNNIMAKFINTGLLPGGGQPQYLDHTQIGDYTEMLNQITEVQQKFQQYPSKIRARFQNNPAKYLEFLQDNKNKDEAIKLGIIAPPPKPDAQRVGAPIQPPEPTLEEKANQIMANAKKAIDALKTPSAPEASQNTDTRSGGGNQG